jgi:hypothetical protein
MTITCDEIRISLRKLFFMNKTTAVNLRDFSWKCDDALMIDGLNDGEKLLCQNSNDNPLKGTNRQKKSAMQA